MADQKNQNQGSQDSQTGKNPQGQASQQPTSSAGNNLRDKDKRAEEEKRKGTSDLNRDRKGAMNTRNEELETPQGRAGSEARDEEEDQDRDQEQL